MIISFYSNTGCEIVKYSNEFSFETLQEHISKVYIKILENIVVDFLYKTSYNATGKRHAYSTNIFRHFHW